jgi:preprotein translocase subunit SecG
MLTNLVMVIQILAGLVIVGLVLVQHGKGADMGASFGSGSSGSLFGATGSANFLSRSTAISATIFFACTLFLAFAAHSGKPRESTGILDRPAPATAADLIPSSASAPAASAVPAPAQAASAVPAPAQAESAVPAAEAPSSAK